MKEVKRKKEEEASIRSDQIDLQCSQPGCNFTTQDKAGLVNHQRQEHQAAAQRSSLVVNATKTVNSKVIAIEI